MGELGKKYSIGEGITVTLVDDASVMLESQDLSQRFYLGKRTLINLMSFLFNVLYKMR